MGRTPAEQEIRVCKAIRLLAEGWEPAKVAQVIKVRRGTLAVWMADDDFKNQLEAISNLGRTITWDDVSQEAMQALRRILQDKSSAVVVRAAREILDQTEQYQKKRREEARYSRNRAGDDDEPRVVAPWAERNPIVRKGEE